MNREQILEDIRNHFGMVPEEYNQLPDDALESNWLMDKLTQLRETKIPLKYKHLIGLAAAATLGNRRLCFAHREFAKHFGASDDEIVEALNIARNNAGRSAFLTGAGIEMDTYREEVRNKIQNLRQRKAA